MGCEYVSELTAFIERTNCRKGCIHADMEDGGQWVNCSYGLLGLLYAEDEAGIPEFEAHGNSYVVCTKREAPRPAQSPVDQGPDLFAAEP